MARTPNLKMGEIIGRGTKHLTTEEIAAYDVPYPNNESKVFHFLDFVGTSNACRLVRDGSLLLYRSKRTCPVYPQVQPLMPSFKPFGPATYVFSSV